jgi:hypothetical protein
MKRNWLILLLVPVILLAQVDWNKQVKNKPSLWNDPGSGTLLKRTGAFIFAAASAGTDYMGMATSIVKAQTPFTTKGDLWVTDGSAMHRLAVGTDGKALVADAASTDGVKWNTITALTDPGSNGIIKRTALNTTGIAVGGDLPLMVASGGSHSAGAVPDPGSSAGATKFLREDASWAVPNPPVETLSFTAPTLLNSWVNFGAPHMVAGYAKSSNGQVFVRGLVKSGSLGNAAFTLPVGYRPSATMKFPIDSAGAYGYIDLLSTGDVLVFGGSNANCSLNFSFWPQ